MTARNRRGVTLALSGQSLFDQEPLPLTWAIVDAPSALADPGLVADLAGAGIKTIIDTASWRFADPRTWSSPKWASLTYTPDRPLDGSREWVDSFVEADLCTQAQLGASTLVVPGWFPDAKQSTVGPAAEWALDRAKALLGREVPIMPLIAFIPGRRTRPDLVDQHVQLATGRASGALIQFSPANPIADPVDRLWVMVQAMLAAQAGGLPVMAGHLGAVGNTIRALGIAAADCGIAEAESFDLGAKVRGALARPPRPPGQARTPTPRVYLQEIGRSVDGSTFKRLAAVPAALAQLTCRRGCCRFAPAAEMTARAIPHSLRCRVTEAESLAALPASMRVDHVLRELDGASTRLAAVNSALADADQVQMTANHLDTQKALLARWQSSRGAA